MIKKETLNAPKTFEVLRGEENNFEIEVKNPYSSSILQDLTLTLRGFPEQYVSILPERIPQH